MVKLLGGEKSESRGKEGRNRGREGRGRASGFGKKKNVIYFSVTY